MLSIQAVPENITWWEIATKSIPIILTIIFGSGILKKISDKISPHKEINILLDQVNAYYKNIQGKAIYRKNGIIHIRFINAKSPRKNKKYSRAVMDLIKNVTGKYEIVSCSLSEDNLYLFKEFDDFKDFINRKEAHLHFGIEGLIVSLDELRKIFQCLNYKKNQEDFMENAIKFIKKAERENFILAHVWKYERQNEPDFFQKYNILERSKLPEYCFIKRPKYCYILQCGSDAKIQIKVLPAEKFEKVDNDPTENIGQDIIAARMIVNMPPGWMPEFLKRFRTYYPWGCTAAQLFKAIKYWEKSNAKEPGAENGNAKTPGTVSGSE